MLRYEFTQVFLSVAQVIQLYGLLFLVVIAGTVVAFVLSVVVWNAISNALRPRARQGDRVDELERMVVEQQASLYRRGKRIEVLESELHRARVALAKARQLGDLVGRIGA